MTSNHIAWYNLMETKRHNVALEMQNLGSLQEVNRHNVAVENETHRSNVVYEQVAMRNATVNERNATVNERNAVVNERNAAVNERNAAVNERNAATNEYNAATNRQSVAIRAQELQETITHNRAMEDAKTREMAISRAELHNKMRDTDSLIALRDSQISLNRSNTALNNVKRGETAANADLKRSEISLNQTELQYADNYYQGRNVGQGITNVRNVIGTITDTVNLGSRLVGIARSAK